MDTTGSILLLENSSTRPKQARIHEQVAALAKDNSRLRESLEQVEMMFAKEDVGWRVLYGMTEEFGMTLEELKHWSLQIKNAQVGNPHIKNGLRLRTSYVWQGGIQYKGVPGASQGRGTNVQKLIDDRVNQKNFFGASARAKREGSLFADSIALYVGDNKSKRLHYVPLREITGEYRDPNFDADVWAYRRTWTQFKNDEYGRSVGTSVSTWYFVDTFYDQITPTISVNGINEPVDQNSTAFDIHANPVDGYAYGSPDALAATIWSRIVKDLFMDGIAMTDAMATFAFKAQVASKAAHDSASIKFATPQGAGTTAVVGTTNDLVPMASAGKGYDFDSFRGVVAIIAASLNISVIALTSDPGTSGSSYGSAQTLDLPTRLAMEARRDEHIDLDSRVLAWMGAPDADVYFHALTDPADKYRQQEGEAIKWDTGLYSAIEIKTNFEAIEGNNTDDITVPDGVIVPNNESGKWMLSTDQTADPNATPVAPGAPGAPAPAAGSGFRPTQGSPAKGKPKGLTAGTRKSGDLRTDTISK